MRNLPRGRGAAADFSERTPLCCERQGLTFRLRKPAAGSRTRRVDVTELVQPLAAAPTEPEAPHRQEQPPSFTELVYAHFTWWRAMHEEGGVRTHTGTPYHRVRARFEEHHGRVVHAYWCSDVESAVALTERPRLRWWHRRRLDFHRESDWATKAHPEIAAELHRCDDLAVRAQTILTGVRQRICLQLVAASAAHLLSLVDSSAGHDDDEA